MLNIRIKILIILILIPILLYMWPAALGGDTEILIVQGQSMFPTILPGSVVIAKNAPPYQIDDIVAYSLKERGVERVVVHRIIAEGKSGFTIQGDNNPKPDSGFHTEDSFLGRVVLVVPYVGDILGLFRNPIALAITAIIIVAVQMTQKRRKKHREKMRRIRLGLPKPDLEAEDAKKTPKKPDYTVFYGAIAFNIFTYVMLQISFYYHIKPQGDILTGFLFRSLEPSFASTIVFGFYFVLILGVYFVVKLFERRKLRKKPKKQKKSTVSQMLLGKNADPALTAGQFVWLMFIMLSLFHLMTIGQDLNFILTCDPAVNLDCK